VSNAIDLAGHPYGRLTVIEQVENVGESRALLSECGGGIKNAT